MMDYGFGLPHMGYGPLDRMQEEVNKAKRRADKAEAQVTALRTALEELKAIDVRYPHSLAATTASEIAGAALSATKEG